MGNGTQPELVAKNGRRFAGYAVAVLVFIVDPATRKFLLLSSPPKRGRTGWEVVNGAMESGETPLSAALRESGEEAGPDVRLRSLGVFHAGSFRYDEAVTHMIDIAFVAAYEGGPVVPGDDMAASQVEWASIEDVRALAADDQLTVPPEVEVWERALQCFDLWNHE